MKSVMSHDFSRVPQADIPRSVFNRSHAHKTTFDAGYLVPVYVDEAMPGDSFNMSATIFARLATPLYPIMDNMQADLHFFAVPIRLVWDNFVYFMGEKVNPDDDLDFEVPQIVAPAATGWTAGSLADYFGIPTEAASISTSSLWHRAYNLIFNEWYRDQNIQDSVVVDKDDGPDSAADYVLLRRCKRHDYFTSALPWPQKGPAVQLPLGTEAPVLGIGSKNQVFSHITETVYESDGTASVYNDKKLIGDSGGDDRYFYIEGTAATGYPYIRADLSQATAATINSLREAFQLQRLYERDARGGTRYTELVKAHFGVTSPDSRLQRPEYIGGGSSVVGFTSVPQTSESSVDSPQGNVSAFGTLTLQGGFTKSFTEHTLLIGILSVRADLTYQQGLPRMFSRLTKHDFYWPGLAHLGEQAILEKEIYCTGGSDDNDVFGYQERWAEYRYYPSKITGQMRSNYATPLDAWHLSQEFGNQPTLSPEFIVEDPPMSRILAVDGPHFIMDSFFSCRTARPMPVYSVPGLIDHF